MLLSTVLYSWQRQSQDPQRINQFYIYQAQMDTVGMAGLGKHQSDSRAQSSPAATMLAQAATNQPVKHVSETGKTP